MMIEITMKTGSQETICFPGCVLCGSSALCSHKENLLLDLYPWNSQRGLPWAALFYLPGTAFNREKLISKKGAHRASQLCWTWVLAGMAEQPHITANKTCHPSVILMLCPLKVLAHRNGSIFNRQTDVPHSHLRIRKLWLMGWLKPEYLILLSIFQCHFWFLPHPPEFWFYCGLLFLV